MIKKLLLFGFITAILAGGGCVKDTYDMKLLSKKAHLSPTLVLSAVKGDMTLSDIVKQSDTVVFGDDKLLKVVFKIDTVLDFKMTDFLFSKSMVDLNGGDTKLPFPDKFNAVYDYTAGKGLGSAAIEPATIDFDIKEILDHITGTINMSNPSIKLNYSNSFTYPVQLNLDVKGLGKDTVDLNLAPFTLQHPVLSTDPEVKATFIIDKSNSSLPALISIPPERISISGNAVMDIIDKKSNMQGNYILGSERLVGSLEVEIPMEFRMNNLQFTDTVDNFMIDKGSGSDNPIKPENFDSLRIDIRAKNGFPLGASLSMELYDPITKRILSKVDAKDIIKPAPVDNNGKVKSAEVTEASTSIEFTKEFFSSINKADKIIFRFTLNTTDSSLNKDVKIYSDYHIYFEASLVVKPDIIIDLK